MNLRLLLTTGFLCFISIFSYSQCVLVPVSIEERVAKSDLIVEGKITRQVSFKSQLDNHIYTANYIAVTKVFKGSVTGGEVVLISPGGRVGDRGETLHPAIYVNENITGTFFLYHGKITFPEVAQSYQPYSGPQGCIYYDIPTGRANDVFEKYESLEEVHQLLASLTGQSFSVRSDLPERPSQPDAAPIISSISPIRLSAGVGDILEIRGSNFGINRNAGLVSFKNASSGPTWIEPYVLDYKTWSDTLIEVRVPSDAGTGSVRVDQNGTAVISDVTILFAHLNVDRTDYGTYTVHRNNNGSGGFDWRMSSDFNSNSGAKSSFIRAMDRWRDHSCINWSNSNSTNTNDDTQDNINNVRFADSGELNSGVLATTRQYWKYCAFDFAFTDEIDMSFDPDKIWNFTSNNPNLNQYDIESVAVHELGHAHNLGHVIDPGDFMHYSIGPGTMKRDFTNNNVLAGNYTMIQNVQPNSCGPAPMLMAPACTPAVNVSGVVADNTELSAFPVPFSEELNINHASADAQSFLKIYNTQGMLVDVIQPSLGSARTNWNPSSDILSGLYLVIFENDGSRTGTVRVLYQP